MLAQNFMTAEALGISEIEFRALVEVLGMLERGEIPESEFDMSEVKCDTAACLCGWAWTVSKGEAFPEVGEYMRGNRMPSEHYPKELLKLFKLNEISLYGPIPTDQAAIALRNYLTFGEPRWSEVT